MKWSELSFPVLTFCEFSNFTIYPCFSGWLPMERILLCLGDKKKQKGFMGQCNVLFEFYKR